MLSSELSPSEYNPFYHTYIKALGGEVKLLDQLVDGRDVLLTFIKDIPYSKFAFSYDIGKWTLAEVLMHIVDAERVFQYRALRFARNDSMPLAGFDQNIYVPESKANAKTKESIMEEYKTVRDASIALFRSFDDEALKRMGNASGSDMSTRAMGFIICGHQAHHMQIIRERYLDWKK
ncbi:DinB family protein [Flagellimonas myxillae]|uniref:DinB family protein n=1 Tax=Flagellimonas myxillae TaxID=2942214 RepID=UPI00201EE827|nr:DinB family protein [Muricauda myxillae]MCL6266043.1 DinB family protein [Muricauda myxillae]